MKKLIQIQIEIKFHIESVIPEHLYPFDHTIHDYFLFLKCGRVIEVCTGDQFLIPAGQIVQKQLLVLNRCLCFFALFLKFAALCFGLAPLLYSHFMAARKFTMVR